MDVCILAIFLLSILVYLGSELRADLQVKVQKDGRYSIAVDGKVWLRSGPTFFNKDNVRWSTDGHDKALVLKNTKDVTCGDSIPRWKERQFTYTYGNRSDNVRTAIRTFAEADTVIFTQTFVSGSNKTSRGRKRSLHETISGFPSFRVKKREELGFLSFGGKCFGDVHKTTGRFTHATKDIQDGLEGGPLALFNKKGQTIVISPYDTFMAASMWHVKKHGHYLTWGIMGGVDSIPANFTYKTIIRYGSNINEAFNLWGETLASQFNNSKSRAGNQSQDVSLNYLGYWTNKGAYYWYAAEEDKNYEDTVKDVREYATNKSIPYRYLELDSWWYWKRGEFKALKVWAPVPDAFPHGFKALNNATGWNFAAHGRTWSKYTGYAKKYNWVMEKGKDLSMPDDLDWMQRQMLYFTKLQTSLTYGRNWLMQMGQAAAEQGITLQYTMANPRQVLQSLEIPAVTQGRVSYNYLFAENGQWRIGVTSIFADAMGIRPSKDTFWTTGIQPGYRFDKTEPFPDMQAAIASLSMGPVGPGDGIGNTNRDLLMRCCREDGALLRPSKPVKAIDKQVLTVDEDRICPSCTIAGTKRKLDRTTDLKQSNWKAFANDNAEPRQQLNSTGKDAAWLLVTNAFNYPKTIGEIWGTYTDVKVNSDTIGRFGILFAADIRRPITVTTLDLWFDLPKKGVYYPYNDSARWQYYNQSTSLDLRNCSMKDFCLYHFSPLLESAVITALLGETGKWIPMSPDRFTNILATPEYVTVTLVGAPGERVPVSYIVGDKLFNTICYVSRTGTKTDCNLIWTSFETGPGNIITTGVCLSVTMLLGFLIFWKANCRFKVFKRQTYLLMRLLYRRKTKLDRTDE